MPNYTGTVGTSGIDAYNIPQENGGAGQTLLYSASQSEIDANPAPFHLGVTGGKGGKGGVGMMPFGNYGGPQSAPNGGVGGAGGAGQATAGAVTAAALELVGTGGVGGNGGAGGVGNNIVYPGAGLSNAHLAAGNGGNGGNGGAGGQGASSLAGVTLTSTTIATTLTAMGGLGGDGGVAGAGGAGFSGSKGYGAPTTTTLGSSFPGVTLTQGYDGSNGTGGAGGAGSVVVLNLAAGFGALNLNATGGDGGKGPSNGLGSMGGAGGAASINVQNSTFTGAADNDVLALNFALTAGKGGTGGFMGMAGATSLTFAGNTITGGHSNETLALTIINTSWGPFGPINTLNIDLGLGTLDVGTTPAATGHNTISGVDNVTLNLTQYITNPDNSVLNLPSVPVVTGNDNANVLTLLGAGGGTLNGGGGADTLRGNSASNTLDGGSGVDAMYGGGGNDTYVVDDTHDVASEQTVAGVDDGGIDTVNSSVTFRLDAFVEKLNLTGSDAVNGTGNALDNVMTGNGAINILKGLGGNDLIDGGAGTDRMYGGAGDDTYVVDTTGDKIFEETVAGVDDGGTDTVKAWANYVLSSHVENLILMGSDGLDGTGSNDNNTLTGNDAINTLRGMGGNDLLDGGLGADRMYGGAGDDTYIVDTAGEKVFEETVTGVDDGGIDTVRSSVAFVLGAHIENLVLTGSDGIAGTGNDGNNTLTGNDAINVLKGLGGNDWLDGGLGPDRLYGGAGDDTYVVDTGGEKLYEETVAGVDDGGTDTVRSSISWTLGLHLENLVLTGTSALNGTGNALDNTLTGNDAINILKGLDGNDTLDGGLGADRLYGGAGDDTYYVDNGGEKVYEDTVTGVDDGGTDLVISTASFTLGAFLENLTLTGSAALNGNGNELNNTLTGNDAINILKGLGGNDVLIGGLGADRLYGGAGNDTYYVDNGGEKLYEDTVSGVDDGGTDTVIASVTWTLGTYFENLTLTGSAAINGYGNALDNTIFGNDGNNVLDGRGGRDFMFGGAGNDTYYVDDSYEAASEYVGRSGDMGGIDRVYASVTYQIGDFIEYLTLTGTGNIDGTGNSEDNTITGNSGNNVLYGNGGTDTLIGGGGSDTFYFLPITGNQVTIQDFASGTDQLRANGSFFGFASGHSLTADEFSLDTAHGTQGQFIWVASTHTLYWDPDGTDALAAQALLTIYAAGGVVQASDFSFL